VIDSCLNFVEFVSGLLVCDRATCQLDTSDCVERPNCGNGVVEVGEQQTVPWTPQDVSPTLEGNAATKSLTGMNNVTALISTG